MGNVTNNWSSGGTYKHMAEEDKRKARKVRKSPDQSKMIRLKLDDRTSFYFENNEKGRKQLAERIKYQGTIIYEVIEP